jgi:tetratricopeptide (TPR) repeat protein
MVVLVFLSSPWPATGQPARAELVLTGYRALIEAYRDGDTDASRRLLQWRPVDVLAVVGHLQRLRASLPADGYQPATFGWSVRLIEIAVLCNTELAASRDLERCQRDFTLSIARHLLDVLLRGGAHPHAERLTLAITGVLQESLKVDDLRQFLPQAVQRFPSSSELWLSLGSYHELTASQRLAAAREQHLVATTVTRALDEAEIAYRRALSIEPTDAFARVRLGRVLYRKASFAEARTQLDCARTRTLAQAEGYLQQLFCGAVDEATGHPQSAIEAYRRAVALCDRCQIAQFALARALVGAGEPEGASAILRASVQEAARGIDPWSLYDFGQSLQLPQRLADLKASLSVRQ